MTGDHLAETIDRLIAFEPRVDAVVPGAFGQLYRVARRAQGAPLAALAARRLQGITAGAPVWIATGMVSRPYNRAGETDGPPGAAVLARALAVGLGAVPLFLTAAPCRSVLRATLGALAACDRDRSWLKACRVVTFPADPDAGRAAAAGLWQKARPAAVIGVEVPGPNRKGVFHNMAGKDVTPGQARLEVPFRLAHRRRVPTVGIGDRGNEIGFGGFPAALLGRVPGGGRCACPCRASVACAVPADVTVVAFTSNWGAYGVAAQVAAHLGRPGLLHGPEAEARMVRAAVAAGAVDGVTRRRRPTVDGLPLPVLQSMVILLRAAL